MSVEFEQLQFEPAYRKVADALLARITDRRLNAGDRLGCTVTTNAGYLPVTSDMEVVVYVLFEVIP